ncbi:MAG: hypothetical protein WDA75_14265 [Candidatus Latescibacterota bacterium]|jgi:excinuclease ABC subunit A
MPGSQAPRAITVRGAAEKPLQRVDLELPLGRLICLTGPCGSGSRALAVSVLAAESRRRYMLALTPAEREGLGGISRVRVDEVHGLPPAIYHDGRDPRGWRSRATLAAALRVDLPLGHLLQRSAELSCPACGTVCRGYTVEEVAQTAEARFSDQPVLVVAPLTVADPAHQGRVLRELRQAGFLRLRVRGEVVRLDGDLSGLTGLSGEGTKEPLEVVVDRIACRPEHRTRLLEAVRHCRAISRGDCLLVGATSGDEVRANQEVTCPGCGARHRRPTIDDFVGTGTERPILVARARLGPWTVTELEALPLAEVAAVLRDRTDPEGLAQAVCEPLELANRLGLGYLTLGTQVGQLATGERQRLLLASCLSSGLVGLLYVFDGLGSAAVPEQESLWTEGLRLLTAQGNTVLLIDHAPAMLAIADEVREFSGGQVSEASTWVATTDATGSRPPRSPRTGTGWLGLAGEGPWPLSRYSVELPLGTLIVVTGPSGAGKSVFLREVVAAAVRGRSGRGPAVVYRGHRGLTRTVELSDQRGDPDRSLLAALGLFEWVSRLYAETPAAARRGYPAEWFRLDGAGGRCPVCEGRGLLRFDLQLLEDLTQVCPECGGRRYREELLEITWHGLSIADLLDLSVTAAGERFIREAPVAARLEAARQCGLGDRGLGQSCGELEPGEWARLQLSGELPRAGNRDLVLLDGPAGSHHPEDVESLATALDRLVEAGATVVIAEHHPRILAAADWIVALGPGAGPEGGRILSSGPPGR